VQVAPPWAVGAPIEKPSSKGPVASGDVIHIVPASMEARGISDHHGIHSIYFRDPNGHVVELCAKQPRHADFVDPVKTREREKLDAWQRAKATAAK
jgi:hypothetical protein